MSVGIQVSVQGCSVVPVVNGVAMSSSPFNDNGCSTLKEWENTVVAMMKSASEEAGEPFEPDPEWRKTAEEFFLTSQARWWAAR